MGTNIKTKAIVVRAQSIKNVEQIVRQRKKKGCDFFFGGFENGTL